VEGAAAAAAIIGVVIEFSTLGLLSFSRNSSLSLSCSLSAGGPLSSLLLLFRAPGSGSGPGKRPLGSRVRAAGGSFGFGGRSVGEFWSWVAGSIGCRFVECRPLVGLRFYS
jgi:hypothetical protein